MSKFMTLRKALPAALVALVLGLQALTPAWSQTATCKKSEADKLHVILLVAGADDNIGNADMKDIAAMKQAIDTAFAKDSDRVVYHDLTGKNPATGRHYTGAEVLEYIRGMKVGSNDNVLIFHSGHGAIANRNQPEASHILVIDGGQVSRKALMDAALAHSPRGLIVLTDCCSNFMDVPASVEDAELNIETVRNLLLKPSGVISITAAQDGTSATASYRGANPGEAGSAFTVAMTRLWYRMDVTYTNWTEFFPALRSETRDASGGSHEARAFQLGQAR
jgi:hypothetical protein